MKLGIVGLPNVGKSTLFNAITNAGAQAENYAFCTIDPNVSAVEVPDSRIDALTEIYSPKKVTRATIEFVDIAGLVKGAANGEGLGNKFLSHIRQVDAIVHVVRCFENDEIMHVDGKIDSRRDIETVELELILSDLELLERALVKLQKGVRADRSLLPKVEFFERTKAALQEGKPIIKTDLSEVERAFLGEMDLLTAKPMIFVANLAEADFKAGVDGNQLAKAAQEAANERGAQILPICAQIEAELSEMDEDDRRLFLGELGLEKSGLERIILCGYETLGLISFLTAGEPEVRAWPIKRGTKAPEAAGKIHSDLERGFIRAEIVPCEDLQKCASLAVAKSKGLVRSEGREYVMKDGDVVLFRFNV